MASKTSARAKVRGRGTEKVQLCTNTIDKCFEIETDQFQNSEYCIRTSFKQEQYWIVAKISATSQKQNTANDHTRKNVNK